MTAATTFNRDPIIPKFQLVRTCISSEEKTAVLADKNSRALA